MCETTAKLHPFEAAGLGLAPFRLLSMERVWFVSCPGDPGKPGGTCDYCGQGIANVFRIESHDGKRFGVGCDCVAKIGRADNRLLTAVQREKARVLREAKAAERATRAAERRAKTDAELAAQRERNGGLTDAELRQQREAAEAAALAEQLTAENGWLIDALAYVGGDFARDMREALTRQTLASLSPRCVCILRDIYGKQCGRYGSKKYAAAVAEFDSRLPVDVG